MMYCSYFDENGVSHSVVKHDYQVLVKLPEAVYDVIYAYDGDSFSEKLINFVVDHTAGK